VFKAKVGSVADAGKGVALIMQMLCEQKLPRALRQAGRFAIRKFGDKILVGESESRVGFPKPRQFCK
jgi:hypothetical protein